MGIYIGGSHDLVVDRDYNLVEFHGRGGRVHLLTAEQVRHLLGYAHLRHIYWLVEQGHLPYRKFGRELVFIQQDVDDFRLRRGF